MEKTTDHGFVLSTTDKDTIKATTSAPKRDGKFNIELSTGRWVGFSVSSSGIAYVHYDGPFGVRTTAQL